MKFIFADVKKSRELITRVDEYLDRLSHIELSMRLGRSVVSATEYAKSLGSCVMEWEERDKTRLETVLDKVEEIINTSGMIIDDIYIVKTDGSDEYRSAYTRGRTIFLPPNKIAYKQDSLEELILHEFFHVFFRSRKDIQSRLFILVGFVLINEIELPGSLADRKLTNPDGPVLNYCISIKIEDRSIFVCPITMLKHGLNRIDSAKDIMESIEFGLLEIEKNDGIWQPVITGGSPSIIYAGDDGLGVKGLSADMLDPNEVLAEAFVELALNRRRQSFVDYDEFMQIIISPI